MLLSELLAGDPVVTGEVDILGLTADSRAVRPGYLFAALCGGQADGADYVRDALARGAAAVLADAGRDIATGDIPLIGAANPRRRLAQLAARFHGPQPRVIAAVTGTSGKTSVADFTRQIWRSCGQRSASLGTLGVVGDGIDARLPHTTPDPVTLHAALADIAAAGVDHLAIEASSHGLDQYRMDAVEVGAAGFTNLSQDHFDYHPTVDHYLEAKLRLFQVVMAPGGTAVLNVDVPEFARLEQACQTRGHKIVTYGTGPSDLHLTAIEPGRTITVAVAGESYQVGFTLPGTYQALNALCAAGLVMASGITLDQALAAIAGLKGVRGRVERVARHASGAPVYVDYAHKPGALKAVLATLRPLANGRLVVVFGCGGDRDTAKRAIMGRVAASHADRVFITDDNPRSENPAAIRRAVLTGCPEAMEIGDRTEAIAAAVAGLEAGDVLVIAGKGHESGQIIGDQVIPFDDAQVARAAITALDGESL
ncbi:MAG: UDP-N-acetylmuramoyl-L-alanyl-D-glutamate--2,6-diaminopimelate ligase [Alphaproteobacteria bacterium]